MIAARPDLLVIGALTIDRFADGSSSPGGSVMHVARAAAAARGVRLAVITVAGPEPAAQLGLDELRGLAALVERTAADSTATFIHRDSLGGRRLWLERRGGSIRLADLHLHDTPQAVLLAPIADEVADEDLARLGPGPTRAAILQGYLRWVAADGEVRPLPLPALDPRLVAALSQFDLLVASREDLLGEAMKPSDQLAALRRLVGPRPALVVTDGVNGVWTESGHLPAPRVVEGVPNVGAGDIFAAFMLAEPWPRPVPGDFLRQRAESAMLAVAEVLEERGGQAR
jgi:sugar/nucleoside kinase (ribokinase family)